MRQADKPPVRVMTRKIERALARKATPEGRAMAKALAVRAARRELAEAQWRKGVAPKRRSGETTDAFRRRAWRWEQKVNRPQRFGGGAPRPVSDFGTASTPRRQAPQPVRERRGETRQTFAGFLRKLNPFRRRPAAPRRIDL